MTCCSPEKFGHRKAQTIVSHGVANRMLAVWSRVMHTLPAANSAGDYAQAANMLRQLIACHVAASGPSTQHMPQL